MAVKLFTHTSYKIAVSVDCTAFDVGAIGARVKDAVTFTQYLANAIGAYDWSACDPPGRAYLTLPREAHTLVHSGVGVRTNNPGDYLIRFHQGEVRLFLRRHLCAPIDRVVVNVYTTDAYLAQNLSNSERARIAELGCTHVVVAVLAFAEQALNVVSMRHFLGAIVKNTEWTSDEIREKAKHLLESPWEMVAD